MNRKSSIRLMKIGVAIFLLGTVLAIIFAISAHAQLASTQQDSEKMIELGHYYHILGAFAQACTNAYQTQDTATIATCVEISTAEHDYLTPFMNVYNDTMSKVIAGP